MPRHRNRRPAPTHRALIESLENRTLLAVIFADGFEGIFPGEWQLGSIGFNRSATWGDNTFNSATGDWSAFCADNGDDFRSTYDDDLDTYMRRSFSLASASSATLTFDYYLNTERGFDKFYVQARDHFGNWSNLLIDSGAHGALGWQHTVLDLSAYAGDNNVAIGFEFISDDSGVIFEAGGVWVDNVIVEADAGGDPPDHVSPGSGEWIWTNQNGDVARPSSIDSGSDVDFFAFNPDRSGSYDISTTQPLDTMMRIYDSSGQPITPVIDDIFGGEHATLNLVASNWYYIAVAGYQNDTGPYTLSINGPDVIPLVLDPLPGPSYDLTIDSTTDFGGDVDYFQVPAPASATTLNITPTAPFATRVEIYDSSGVLLQSQAGGAITDFPVTGGQIYYVAFLSQSRTDVGNYSVEIDFNPDQGGNTAIISGANWNDYNSDGVRDPNEPGLPGWTIYIDSNENGLLDPGEPNTPTNSLGNYRFTNLVPGTYQLRQVPQFGWLQISPAEPQKFSVQAGQFITNANFSNFPTTFNGSDANDTFTSRTSAADSNRVEIIHEAAGNTITYSINKNIYTSPQFNLGAGDDTVVYDNVPFSILLADGQGTDTLIVRNMFASIESDIASAGMENVEVEAGSLTFEDPQHISSLTIQSMGRVINGSLHVGSLNIAGDSSLIIGALIVDSGDITTITSLIKSSNIVTDADFSNYRLGAIANGTPGNPLYTTFANETGLTGGEILALYTLIGDLNLDKSVSISDFIDLASNFNNGGTWRQGDVNYDGTVTISDFIDLASNFNSSFAGDSEPITTPRPASSILITTHAKKLHHHHHRRVRHIAGRPALFRFQI